MEQSEKDNSSGRDSSGSSFVHPVYGDLGDGRSVTGGDSVSSSEEYCQDSPYMLHLAVTGRCNARCEGCINSTITFKNQPDREQFSAAFDMQPERDSKAILNLLHGRDEDYAVVCFYGGEPLLACDKIQQVIGLLSSSSSIGLRYMLYTNGQLLDEAIHQYPHLFNYFWLVSVSIDGQAEQHDRFRPGTELKKIHHGLRNLSQYPTASVLMWSTLREEQSLTDCFEEYLYLYEHGLADHWFYHWLGAEQPYKDFDGYIRNYENQLRQIMHIFIEFLSLGRILSIVHISELILYLLTGHKRGTTGCGVENDRNYDLAGGKILACADLGPQWALGLTNPDGTVELNAKELARLVQYKNELGCDRCGICDYCGGRCPVEAQTASKERLLQYCQLMRLHVAVVKEYIPMISDAMSQQNISTQRLYDHSAYFAQFTDVTP